MCEREPLALGEGRVVFPLPVYADLKALGVFADTAVANRNPGHVTEGTCFLGLCPLNPTPGSKWTASRREDEEEFVRRLERRGVPVTVRDTRGREIDGACGQLAAAKS
ncbi:hypothetical protein GCM10028864_25900 [Microlunatus parietis]